MESLTLVKEKKVYLSEYTYLTRQVLAQIKPKNWRKLNWKKLEQSILHDLINLINDTVNKNRNSLP